MTKEVFAQLVLDSTDSLYRVSKGILKNDSDCEDAVWEAIGIGFEKLHTLRQDAYAKTWLTRILIHECYAILRNRKHESSLTADIAECIAAQKGCEGAFVSACANGSSPADIALSSLPEFSEPPQEICTDLYAALSGLDEKYRTPIILFYLEGYSVREIAGLLDITEGTIKSRLSRGRAFLRKMLDA